MVHDYLLFPQSMLKYEYYRKTSQSWNMQILLSSRLVLDSSWLESIPIPLQSKRSRFRFRFHQSLAKWS